MSWKGIAKFLHKGDIFSQTFGTNSAVANILHPSGRVLKNAAEGKPTNLRTALDPGGWIMPDPVKPPPGAPTIDEATRNIQESDRLRRRRGVYANIFAGAAAAPIVGKATLGG